MYTQIRKIKIATFISLLMMLGISCSKDDISEEEPVNLEEFTEAQEKAHGLKSPASVMYIEVNNQKMQNAGAYTLPNGKPMIDIAVIFAANINYHTQNGRTHKLSMNPNVRRVLNNRNNTIKPLQRKGIKVLLSILGNHQAVGIANFPTRAEARRFAKEVANVVKNNGLDGVDLDDEFAKYGSIPGRPAINRNSFIWLLQELRAAMPSNKIITYYRIGESTSQMQSQGKRAGQFLDFAFQPFYGSYANINVPGLGKRKKAAAAVDVTRTAASTARDFANRTKRDRYGAFVMYNLDGVNRESYLNGISQGLYGKQTKLTGTLQ
ncbi:glycosyl hydrolase family 18 protein [Aquimarina sp. D1M17]|uniref:endo-beta-N-acetylglucosaminidase H n=1 Tax=Aquimarina acroporae TaxID=2937283 RepID=UPI0020BF5185|nr:endo-beta-N-acetylglucosaminidase H [Aquimarina acroporae]MCK8521000.1 glycosyl hydrolase family 18 protein [Aquimarina acroporae]